MSAVASLPVKWVPPKDQWRWGVKLVTCDACGKHHARSRWSVSIRCHACDCVGWIAKRRASAAVQRAVKRGDLLPALQFDCVDCGHPAHGYDHRDYSQPLVVEPVCRRCNALRGPADISKFLCLPVWMPTISHFGPAAKMPRLTISSPSASRVG